MLKLALKPINLTKSNLNYISNNLEYYKFVEQFSNSPFSSLVNKQEVEQYFVPLVKVLQTGIEQKIIKNVNFNIHGLHVSSNNGSCQSKFMPGL